MRWKIRDHSVALSDRNRELLAFFFVLQFPQIRALTPNPPTPFAVCPPLTAVRSLPAAVRRLPLPPSAPSAPPPPSPPRLLRSRLPPPAPFPISPPSPVSAAACSAADSLRQPQPPISPPVSSAACSAPSSLRQTQPPSQFYNLIPAAPKQPPFPAVPRQSPISPRLLTPCFHDRRKMFKAFHWKPAYRQLAENAFSPQFNLWRGMHSRTKNAMELIAKGFSALEEVERVISYCELNDKRLIPMLRAAKQNFELALEADNSNTHARYWLSKVHLKYHFCPGANKAIGAALLVEAAEMGNPDAQYDLGCCLRAENPYAQSEQQGFYYLEKAVDQLHPGALYLLGAVYLTGDCVSQDISSAIWCFHRASEKGHAGAAIAYGSLLLAGVQLPESLTRFNAKKASSNTKLMKDSGTIEYNPVEMAREQFKIADNARCDLGLKWLNLLDEEEKEKEEGTEGSLVMDLYLFC